MRSFVSFLGFFSLVLALHAGPTTFSATPSTLAGWSVAGAELSAVLGQTELTLPANAQLLRSCRATEVSLQLSTQSVLDGKAESWPVLELGDAALVFVRSGGNGRLVLVLGEQAPRDLPITFALDDKGRSIDALSVGFARSGDVVSVSASGQILKFPAGLISADQSLPIIVSAGAEVPWGFQRLALTVVSVDPVVAPTAAIVSPSPAPAPANGNFHASAPPPWGGRFTSSASARRMVAPLAATPAAGEAGRRVLEIYTPPAVRQSRAELVRAAVQSRIQQ